MSNLDNRLLLHEELCSVLGSRNVYFQPPENMKLKYPAIIYSRSDIDQLHANNNSYIRNHAYQIILVDPDPDSETVESILDLPMCRFDRHYVSDNLNHDVFTIYYK